MSTVMLAEIEAQSQEQTQCHDMEQGVDGNVHVLAVLNVSGKDIVGDVINIGSMAPVVSRYAFGKSCRASGIEDVRKVLDGIDCPLSAG